MAAIKKRNKDTAGKDCMMDVFEKTVGNVKETSFGTEKGGVEDGGR